MRYSILKGLQVVLLIQHSTSEGVSTPIQFPTEVAYQNGQSFPQEPELPIAETVHLGPPPRLKEVQQAMQEASEQVKGRGAEELLKELLERVVEAALGQVEAGDQAKDVALEKEGAEEGPLGVKMGERKAEEEAETLALPWEGRNMSLQIGDNGFEESDGVAEVEALKNIARGAKEVVKEEGETVAGSVEEMTVREAVGLEVTGESLLETKSTQGDVDGPSEKTEGDLEAGKKDSEEQVLLIVLKNATERETQDGEETPATVEVAVGEQPEQETEEESITGLGVADKEQIENSRRKEAALLEKSQTDQMDGEEMLPHPNGHVIQIKPVMGELIKEEGEIRSGENMVRPEKPDEKGVIEQEEKRGVEGTDLREATVEATYGEVEFKEGSVAQVVKGGDNAGEEEQKALEDSEHNEDQGALVIPGPPSEDRKKDFRKKKPEIQLLTPRPSIDADVIEDNTLIDAKSNHRSKIIITNPRFLPDKDGGITPTLERFENDVFAEYHQAEGEKSKGTRDVVGDILGAKEKNEQGLEAWKIGAIFTAVFLGLETVVITIYVLKCRNKKRIAHLEQSDVASTSAIKRGKQEVEHAIAMSELSPSTTEMIPSPGPGSDSSQDFRTSV